MSTYTELLLVPKKDTLWKMDGISAQTMDIHWKLYEGYVNKTNEIRQKLENADLETANQTYSEYRALKVELSFALNGAKNHALYFNNLGGSGGSPDGAVMEAIEKDFGSFDDWKKDLRASGMSARGWVWLAKDEDGHLYNFVGDAQNTYPIWGAKPLLALDTYEHAYFIDHGSDRGKYIDIFLNNIDWAEVGRRLG